MKGAVLVAIAASIGNFLQGWDNATIAGSILYIKKDLALQTTIEGLVARWHCWLKVSGLEVMHL
ncbi:hypothetical protein RYX36_037255 [Vicia faba]